MVPNFKMKHIILCFTFFIAALVNAQFTSIQWGDLKKTEVTGNSLDRITNQTGSALSLNVLYGRDGKDNEFSNGAVRYVTTSNDKGKRLGFSLEENHAFRARDMKYAFYFYKNRKAKVIVNGEVISNHTYSTGDEVKIERHGKFIMFFIAGVKVYEENVDPFENLHVHAIMYNGSSSLDNVEVDFTTERFNVDFVVDNVNLKIDYTITGGTAPYEVIWCTGEKCSTKFNPGKIGTYPVKITDAKGNLFESTVSIGDDLVWQDFDKTIQTGLKLEKNATNGNGWGYARSQFTNQASSNWWVEYTIDIQKDNKFFGVSDAGISINDLEDLGFGFYISKEEKQKIKLIQNGEVFLNGFYRDRDILRLEYEAGVMRWFKNGVLLYEQKETVVQYDTKIIAGVKGAATLEGVRNYSNEPQLIVTAFNDLQGLGNITVNLSSFSPVGPYHYQISDQPIIELTELYTLFRDSLDLDIDSTEFFTGKSTSMNHTFSDLPLGQYYIAVFDSQGKRIHGDIVQLYPTDVLNAPNGVTYSNGVLVSTQDAASTDLKYFLTSFDDNFKLEFDLTDERKKQLFGFTETDVTLTNRSDLVYGFKVNNGRVDVVVNGQTILTDVFVQRNSSLTFEKVDNDLLFFSGDKLLHTQALPDEYSYKSSVYLNKAAISLIVKPIAQVLFKPYRFGSGIRHSECGIKEGAYLNFSLRPNLFVFGGQSINYSGDIFNPAGISIYSFNQTNSFNGSFFGPNQILVSAGTYTLVGTITVGNYTINVNESFEVGYYVESDDIINYDISGTYNNDYKRNNVNSGSNYGTARSNNFIPENIGGWIKLKSEFDSNQIYSREFFNIKSPAILDTDIDVINDPKLGIYKFFGQSYIILTSTNAGGGIFVLDFALLSGVSNHNLDFRIDNNNNLEVRQLLLSNTYSSLIDYNLGTGAKKMLFHSLNENDAFLNVISSYDCSLPKPTLSSISYSKMNKSVDGGYANSAEGKVKLYFDEAYLIECKQDLNFIVKKNDNSESAVPFTDFHLEDDNRYTLDLSGQGLTDGDYYTLVVTISKNKKKYLRFKYND